MTGVQMLCQNLEANDIPQAVLAGALPVLHQALGA